MDGEEREPVTCRRLAPSELCCSVTMYKDYKETRRLEQLVTSVVECGVPAPDVDSGVT